MDLFKGRLLSFTGSAVAATVLIMNAFSIHLPYFVVSPEVFQQIMIYFLHDYDIYCGCSEVFLILQVETMEPELSWKLQVGLKVYQLINS